MEPAAPGTEDDIVAQPATFSKKETEQERLLSLKAQLPNGKYGNVFELSFVYGSESWYCNLCQCPIMGRVYHHEIGKRHTNNMQHSASNTRQSVAIEGDAPELDMQIAPGQPVPPGFEGAVGKTAQIQERLNGFTASPLIGLEYLFELQEYDRDKEPSYLCLLCDKRGDPRTVIAHLASYNHITQYLQRHFITCFRALSPYVTKQYKRNWQSTVQKIAEAIETKFGRLKPHVEERDAFEKNRTYYQNSVATGIHFNEKSGVTFEELVVKEQLTKAIDDEMIYKSGEALKRVYRKSGTDIEEAEYAKKSKHSPSPPVVAKPKKPKPALISSTEKRRSLSSVSSISSSELSDFEPAKQNVVIVKTQKEKSSKHFSPLRNKEVSSRQRIKDTRLISSPYRDRNRERSYDRDLMPWQRSDYIRSRDSCATSDKKPKVDKIEEYKKLAAAIEKDMERILKQHEKNPEKHPQYNEEWKKFWNKRYKELQADGKDATTYDFKPEWIEYWNVRLKEIHTVEIKNKKEALKKRLGIPEEPPRICFKIGTKNSSSQIRDDSSSFKPVPIASVPDQDPDVIVIDDKDSVSSRRSHSPWESESGSRPHSRRSRDKSREHSYDRSRNCSKDRSRSRFSRDRSRERSHRRDRSLSPGYARSRGSRRDRDDRGDYSHRDKVYVRQSSYKKIPDLPEYIQPPRIMRDVTRHPVHSPPPLQKEPEVIFDDNEDLNIVGVLRLLTALEDKLGSLGPKVVNLLSQALSMEKSEANSSETLLDNEINCVMFETVKEKLKGQLLAGFVSYNQEKAIKHAIKKIAGLIHYANERSRVKEKDKPKEDPIKVPGVGIVDKAAIAKQIAAALVNQGKTDVSQAELEQLINAVVGMAEASRGTNKPVTTALFLQQLASNSQQLVSIEQSKSCIFSSSESLISALQQPSKHELTPSSSNSMEGLSDSDLQTLLQNFKDLCNEEQHSLISYLKKLEAKEPERVERLRKFVNLDTSSASVDMSDPVVEIGDAAAGRSSPFSSRIAGHNPTVEDTKVFEEDEETHFCKVTEETQVDKTENVATIKVIDSEDEDYSFEDVVNAAKQNVTANEEKERASSTKLFKSEDFDLSNAKSIIANIMGQFKNSNNDKVSPTNLIGLHRESGHKEGELVLSEGSFLSQHHQRTVFSTSLDQTRPLNMVAPPVDSLTNALNRPIANQIRASSLAQSQFPHLNPLRQSAPQRAISDNFPPQHNVAYPIPSQPRSQINRQHASFRDRTEFFASQQHNRNVPPQHGGATNRPQMYHPSYENYNSKW